MLLFLIGLAGGVTRDGALLSLELLVDHLDGWGFSGIVSFDFQCPASSLLTTTCEVN